MLAQLGLQSIECLIAKNQLRWASHLHGMPEKRYRMRVLYGQMTDGNRPAHGPKRRYKDQLKKMMKNFNIPLGSFETKASDRSAWRGLAPGGHPILKTKGPGCERLGEHGEERPVKTATRAKIRTSYALCPAVDACRGSVSSAIRGHTDLSQRRDVKSSAAPLDYLKQSKC